MPQPQWCPHITWNENPTKCGFGGPDQQWIYHLTWEIPVCVPRRWRFCPRCGRRRP